MDLKHFRLIKTITEEGSIANSSSKLFLTQSALSHQLRELENGLGFKVFHRTRNQWQLTEEGQELYHVAIKVLQTIEQGLDTIKHIQEGSKGLVRISTECYSFYQGLPSFIQKMAVLYPQIDVELQLESTHQPIPKLLSNDIDIAIVSVKPSSDKLSSIELYEDEIFAMMHEESSLAKKTWITAKDLAKQHLIIHSFPLETVSVYRRFLQANGAIPLSISAIPLTEVALELVAANLGVLCMPKWALALFNLPKSIVFKQLGKEGLKRRHYVVSRIEDAEKKYLQDFLACLGETFSKEN